MSAYALKDRTVYLTYSTTARGLELMMGYHGFLDRAPLGRSEGDSPHAATTSTTTRTRRVNSPSPSDRPCGARPPRSPIRVRRHQLSDGPVVLYRTADTRACPAGGSATLGDLLADGNPWLRRAELPGASRAGVLARNRGLRGVRVGAGCRCVR